jgi:hypothetical protein
MKTSINAILIFCLFFLAEIVIAQVGKPIKLILNLAEIEPGEKITVSGNNSFDVIVLKNTLIGKGYSLNISVKNQPIPPLNAPNVSGVSGTISKGDPCFSLNLAYLNLINLFDAANDDETIKTEKEVSARINVLMSEIDKHKCSNTALVDSAKALINKCEREIIEKVIVHSGEIVVITVSRGQKIWTWEFIGESTGEWVISYGFGFCSSALEAKKYHLQQLNDTSFQIKKDEKPRALELSYVPAVFYSFLPSSKYNSDFNWSISAGLGFDLSAPVVFFGGGFMFHQNIGVNLGVAFQQQNKLKPQYSDGQILRTPLEKDQLHDHIYRPNAFISINFRFGKNPFSKNTDTSITK